MKNFQGGGGATEKKQKIRKKPEKPLPGGVGGGNEKQDRKIAILSLSLTIFVPCMKFQEGATAPLPPAADAHGVRYSYLQCLSKLKMA